MNENILDDNETMPINVENFFARGRKGADLKLEESDYESFEVEEQQLNAIIEWAGCF